MTSGEFGLGVDFGTSHTVAVLAWPDGTVRPLLFDGVPQLRSAVCADPIAGLIVGQDAEHAGRTRPEAFEPNPKRRVDDGTVLLGGLDLPVVDLIGAVLRRVAGEANRVSGVAVTAVTLTVPADWGPRRREVLRIAAGRAGWTDPRFVVEPVAAATHFIATAPPGSKNLGLGP